MRGHLLAAIGTHQKDGAIDNAYRKLMQELQSRGIRPVDVVKRQHEPAVIGDREEELD